MQAMVDLPDDIAERIAVSAEGDLSRRALEALAAEGYRQGKLHKPDLRRLLGFETSDQIDTFLKEHEIWIEYARADLEREMDTFRRLGI